MCGSFAAGAERGIRVALYLALAPARLRATLRGMNPLRPIRRLIGASNLSGVTTPGHAARRGAWIGLRWACLIVGAPLGICLLLAGMITSYIVGYAGVGIIYDARLLELSGALIGCIAVSCGWGVVLGAGAAMPAYFLRKRRASVLPPAR